MSLSISVEGLKELQRALNELEDKTSIKVLRKAGRKAMKPVLEDAKAGAGKDSGGLVASLRITTKRKKRSDRDLFIDVGPTKSIGADSESRKKTRQSALLKALAQEYGNREDKSGGGQEARPFLRPALDRNSGVVIAIFKSELTKAIDKALKGVK